MLAREQLAAANQRAQALEQSVQERDAESARLRSRVESLEAECADGRAKLEAASLAHQTERSLLQERHTTAERHSGWSRLIAPASRPRKPPGSMNSRRECCAGDSRAS